MYDVIARLKAVSILAHAEARALRRDDRTPCRVKKFQSSPTPKRGRYTSKRFYRRTGSMFQSSPTPKRGRYWMCFAPDSAHQIVSILAHAEARALHQAGAARDRRVRVSILAHAEARALHGIVQMLNAAKWFQSSPTPKRGRYVAGRVLQRQDEHVSILAHAEARALRSDLASGGLLR